ncbi:hypothetical protein MHZ92_16490 [Sporosarcina sp. ACRSL]|uniref:hypothetical protein n=1 Tax=Sporosarcina sp. ACRSL TaxID=2918215 RepID=UPI001EF5FAC2|nr:hypothetical protein [Sporosarcina sp. ACRSL]MCG7345714.1 hypothetical protein [Sporosarcina sp. ACRSL]
MNSKNVIKILVAMLLLLGYASLNLFKENRELKQEAGWENKRAVNETIEKLKNVYDKDHSYWEVKIKQENGEILLEQYISELRKSEWYFLFLDSSISRVAVPLKSIGDHLEELKEEGTLSEEKKTRMHEDVLLVRTVLGQVITIAEGKRNGWYKEFRDGDSDIANYVKKEIDVE